MYVLIIFQTVVPPELVTLPYLCQSKKSDDDPDETASNGDAEQTGDPGNGEQVQKPSNAGNEPIHVSLRYRHISS